MRNSKEKMSSERGVCYWEYLVLVSMLTITMLSAVPDIKAQISAVDQNNSTIAANNDAYPSPLVP